MYKTDNHTDWILCPSSRFPGRFYYFNVVTGESIWSINSDQERKLKKINSIKKITCKFKNIPEPLLSPDVSPSFSNGFSDELQMWNLPVFGQATFQNYISKPKPTVKRLQLQRNILSPSKLFVHKQNIQNRFQKLSPALKSTVQNKNMPILQEVTYKSPSFVITDFESTSTLPKKEYLNCTWNKNITGTGINDKQLETITKFNTPISICFLRNLGNVPKAIDWYIVAEKNVLLEDFDCLAKFIDKDKHCKLLTPKAFMVEIESISRQMSNLQSVALSARILLRRLSSYEQHVQQPEEDAEDEVDMYVTLDIQTIKCCLLMKKRKLHVVLITKSVILNYRAKVNDIHAFSINEIKDKPDANTTDEDTQGRSLCPATTKQNIFLQSTHQFDPFILSKSFESDTNETEQDLFKSYDLYNYKQPHTQSKYVPYPNIYSDVCRGIERLNTSNNSFGYRAEMGIASSSRSLVLRNMNTYTEPRASFLQEDTNSDNNENYFETNNTRKISMNTHTQKSSNVFKYSNYENDAVDNEGSGDSAFAPARLYLEQNLKRFHIQNHNISMNIRIRFEEWACCYLQIMEQFIFAVRLKSNLSRQLSYRLQAQLEDVKEIFSNNERISLIVDKLIHLYDSWLQAGKFNRVTPPETVMTILGCSVLLIEEVGHTSPCEQITDSRDMLNDLIIDIQKPPPEDIFTDINYSVKGLEQDSYPVKEIYTKHRSEVAAYINKHFHTEQVHTGNNTDSTSCREVQKYNNNHNLKIVKTTGKYTSLMKINSKNQLEFLEPQNAKTDENNGTSSHNRAYKTENQDNTKENDMDVPILHKNTFDNERGIKVLRVIKYTNDYKNNLNITISTTAKGETKENDINTENSIQNTTGRINRMKPTNSCKSSEKNADNIKVLKNIIIDERNDAVQEVNNDHLNVYEIIQTISFSLRATLLRIRTICLNTIKEIQDGATKERKKFLHTKTSNLHRYIVLIIEQLEKIVDRESILPKGFTKPAIALTDKAMYRDTVLKFLSKTQMLEHILSKLLDEIREQ